MNKVQMEDCRNIGSLNFIDWNQFRNTTILITGSTGLIGSNFVNAVAYNSKDKNLNIKLKLLVRNVRVAEEMFSWTGAELMHYELGTKIQMEETVDYIVHLASPTSSRFFVEKPVDTMLANIEGVKAMLEWAKEHPIRKLVDFSTMEVYGFPEKGHKVEENELGSFDTMHVRNSYPIAKITGEALCNSYYAQYAVPAVVLRGTQTFGPGVKYDDGRVFAEFMRCAIERTNIVLKSEGMTERSYLYTADAVSAILVALLRGVPGESYTVANPDTLISIKNMAQMVADKIADGQIKVVFDVADNIEKLGYAQTLYMDLNVEKMKKLGWRPYSNLESMFEKMIRGMENE